MSKQIICPYCFSRYDNSEVMCQCENNEIKIIDGTKTDVCPPEVDRVLSNWRRKEGLVRKHIFKSRKSLFSSEPKPTKCDRCGTESHRFVCPKCHNWLPSEMAKEGSEIISIIGAPSSGKSVYFTSLISTLENYGYRLGLDVRAKDEAFNSEERTSQVFNSMKKNMFSYGELPDQTTAKDIVTPLIFKLTSSVESGKYSDKDRHIYLVFYDTAGEVFTTSEALKKQAVYLAQSSGIILLLDPFSIPKLKNLFINAGLNVPGDRDEIQVVIDKILGDADDDRGRYKDTPLAVTFSKIDAVVNGLEQAGEQSIPNLDLYYDSSFLKAGRYSVSETDNISKSLSELCNNPDKWDIGNVLHKIGTAFRNYKVFGVSSLGTTPDKDNSQHVSGQIKPYRVLDPLVWILTQMKGFHIPLDK